MKLAICHAIVAAAVMASATAASAQPGPPAQTGCGTVTVAEMNWPSAAVIAHIDAIILEAAFGCDVVLTPGDTLATINSMLRDSEPDIAPETWINSDRERLDDAVARRILHYGAAVLQDGGIEGWWIPKFIADAHPEIRTIEDALQRPDLFPAPGDPESGGVHTCPTGWSCEVTMANLFRAYDGEAAGFTLVSTASDEDLVASIEEAFETRTGWLGYYWAPTPALGRFDMVKLSFNVPHDPDLWNRCIVVDRCPVPQKSGWPRSEVYTLYTDAFARANPAPLQYLRARSWQNATVNTLLAWMYDQDASAAETARHFLRTYDDVWEPWLTEQEVSRVADLLEDETADTPSDRHADQQKTARPEGADGSQ
jgi:glycine betaine/proline transport system substrate-binding protein